MKNIKKMINLSLVLLLLTVVQIRASNSAGNNSTTKSAEGKSIEFDNVRKNEHIEKKLREDVEKTLNTIRAIKLREDIEKTLNTIRAIKLREDIEKTLNTIRAIKLREDIEKILKENIEKTFKTIPEKTFKTILEKRFKKITEKRFKKITEIKLREDKNLDARKDDLQLQTLTSIQRNGKEVTKQKIYDTAFSLETRAYFALQVEGKIPENIFLNNVKENENLKKLLDAKMHDLQLHTHRTSASSN